MISEAIEVVAGIHQLRVHFDPDVWVACYVLTGERPALIDTGGVAEDADAFVVALRKLGLDPHELRHLVITHRHHDHAGGAAALRARTGATIYAHAVEAPFLERPEREIERQARCYPDLFRSPDRGGEVPFPDAVAVDRRLRDGEGLELGDDRWRVVHTPGHCSGLVALYCEARGILLASDSLQGSGNAGGGALYDDVDAYRGSVERVRSLRLATILLGHPFDPHLDGVCSGRAVDPFIRLSLATVERYETIVARILERTPGASFGEVVDAFRRELPRGGSRLLAAWTVQAHLNAERPLRR